MGTEPEVMLTEWEQKYGLETEHVNVSNNEDVKQKLANHEIDCFVSLEGSFWAERGISTITRVGESGIYYAINKNRPDIKEELDDAMLTLSSMILLSSEIGTRSCSMVSRKRSVTQLSLRVS